MEKSGTATSSKIPDVLNQPEDEIVADWVSQLGTSGVRSDALIKAGELRSQCGQFLQLFRPAMLSGDWKETASPPWGAVRDFLGDVSRSRSTKGFTPSQIAS